MIYERIRKRQNDSSDCKAGKGRFFESGADMFGFSNLEVTKLIQVWYYLLFPLDSKLQLVLYGFQFLLFSTMLWIFFFFCILLFLYKKFP